MLTFWVKPAVHIQDGTWQVTCTAWENLTQWIQYRNWAVKSESSQVRICWVMGGPGRTWLLRLEYMSEHNFISQSSKKKLCLARLATLNATKDHMVQEQVLQPFHIYIYKYLPYVVPTSVYKSACSHHHKVPEAWMWKLAMRWKNSTLRCL